MQTEDHVIAYRQLRELMHRARLSLRDLRAQLAGYGFNYSYDAVASWGRATRRFPRDPRVLEAMARILAQRLPAVRTVSRDILRFLLDAGYPYERLHTLRDFLDLDTL
jgi:hypothetical protein